MRGRLWKVVEKPVGLPSLTTGEKIDIRILFFVFLVVFYSGEMHLRYRYISLDKKGVKKHG